MGVWTVWENERFGDAAPLRARFVRDSFSWAAFLFAPLWLLANGMIVVLLVLGVVAAGAAYLAQAYGVRPESLAGGGVVLALWFGFEARALRRWSLSRRGWRMIAVVEARRLRTAERRYFEDRTIPDPVPLPARRPSPLPAVPPLPFVPPLPAAPPPLPGGPIL